MVGIDRSFVTLMQGTNGASYAKVALSVNDSLTLVIQTAQPRASTRSAEAVMVNFRSMQICVLQAIFVRFAMLTQQVVVAVGGEGQGKGRGEEGQGLSEYVLLVSLMVGLVVSVMTLYTSPLATFYNSMVDTIDVIFSGVML